MSQVRTVSLVVVVWPVPSDLWRQLEAAAWHLVVCCGRYRKGWLLLLECILAIPPVCLVAVEVVAVVAW